MNSFTDSPPHPVSMSNTQTAECATEIANSVRAQRPAKLAINEFMRPSMLPKQHIARAEHGHNNIGTRGTICSLFAVKRLPVPERLGRLPAPSVLP
jgi:hypothetical protein